MKKTETDIDSGSGWVLSRDPTAQRLLSTCPSCKSSLEYTPTKPSPLVKCWQCGTLAIQTQTRPQTSSTKSASPPPPQPKPSKFAFYEILGVPPTALQTEIKRAYHVAALKCHPDKNPGNAECEERFKVLSRAYFVLSDPDMRASYDRYGRDPTEAGGADSFDPVALFQNLFGGPRFNEIIGIISLAKDLQSLGAESREKDKSVRLELTKERVDARAERVRILSEHLVNRLSVLTETTMDEFFVRAFEARSRMEALELQNEPRGADLLHAVGYTYISKARQYNGGLAGLWNSVTSKTHVASDVLSTVKSTISLHTAFIRLSDGEKSGTLSPEEMSQLEKAAAAQGLDALWKGSKLEIEGVIRDVCDVVLGLDSKLPTVPPPIAKKRAVALKILGQIYQEADQSLPASQKEGLSQKMPK